MHQHESMAAYILPKRVCVRIERGVMEKTEKVVLEHEPALLAQIHGEGNISIVSDPTEVGIFIGEPAAIEARTKEEMRDVDAGVIATIYSKFTLYPAKPIRVEEEIARLERTYGVDPESKKPIVDVVYGNPRINPAALISAAGGKVTLKSKQVKEAA